MLTCSIHHDRTDRSSAALVAAIRDALPVWHVDTVGVDAFADPFRGTYVTRNNATESQQRMLEALVGSDAVVHVVPSYFKSPPGAAKNAFDTIDCPEAYADKVHLFVSSNHKNQDFGARELQRVVQAVLELKDLRAVLVPEIPVVDPDHLTSDATEVALARVAHLLEQYGCLVERPAD